MTGGFWCDDCGKTHPVTSRAGRDLCRGCAEEHDTENGQDDRARYRNPPRFYGVEGEVSMGENDQ